MMTRRWLMDICYLGLCCSFAHCSSSSTEPGPDNSPPTEMASGFTAVQMGVNVALSWTNPSSDVKFDHVVIVRKLGGASADIEFSVLAKVSGFPPASYFMPGLIR